MKASNFVFTILVFVKWQIHAFEKEHYMEMGVCENVADGTQRCAMQKSDCEPTHIDGEKNPIGEKWYSAYRQRQRGYKTCACSETTMGVCASIDLGKDPSFRCAPQAQTCLRDTETFGYLSITNENSCNCAFKANDTNQRTKYGACQDVSSVLSKNYFCAFSPDDCEGNHVWIYPEDTQNVINVDCLCEDVRVGGCVGGFADFHCSLTKDDCNWDKFIPPISLKQEYGHTCRLCEPSEETPIFEMDELDAIQKKTSTALIVGISVASTCSLVILAAGIYCYILKTQDKRNNNSSTESQKNTKIEKSQSIRSLRSIL